MSLVRLEGVSKSVTAVDGSELRILDEVDLEVDAGEQVSVVGRSGSGKSTLLNIVGLLDAPTAGRHLLDGVDVQTLSGRRRSAARGRDIGFVFQQFNLIQGRTALDNVCVPLLYDTGAAFWRRRRIAAEMLERVGLGGRLGALPRNLSGGEQQRVAVARALVRRPRVILADEPTGALDLETGETVMELMAEVAAAEGAALIVITHDQAVAERADRRFRLAGGVLRPDRAIAGGQA